MKTNFSKWLLLAGLTPAAMACQSDGGGGDPDAEPIVVKSEYQAKTLDIRSFALDLFKTTVAKSDGANLLLSPYSVNVALNMAWNGAAGETADELGDVLGNGSYTKEQIGDYSSSLTSALLKVDPKTELRIANSIWANNTTPFKASFVQSTKAYYNAEARNVDFTQQETFDAIDKWGRDNTNNKIDKISAGMDDDTKFALINAVYFNANWKYKFETSRTKIETFTNADGTEALVQMMNQKRSFDYWHDDDWKMISLPYGNQAFSMVLLMPYADEPLDAKIATLTTDKFYSLLNSLGSTSLPVKLPKFKLEYSCFLQEEVLPAMGVRHLFNPLTANLNEMSETSMFVKRVLHKTYIDVHEEGTEAAAVTVISGNASAGPSYVHFYADRPFICSIVENSTGTILFMGRINKF